MKDMINASGLPAVGSNRGYDSSALIEGFLDSVILGAKRLSHSGTVGNDPVVNEIFNWKKGMASASTFSRLFRRFDLDTNDVVMRSFNKAWFEKVQIEKHTIDVDSSVITRYGPQEGAEVGYHPHEAWPSFAPPADSLFSRS